MEFYKKNAVKGTVFYLGPVMYGICQGSAGYERSISKHNVLEISGNYFRMRGSEDEKLEAFCIISGYKYVFYSDRKIFNNTWYSGYLAYFKMTAYASPDYEYDDGPVILYLNGLGCAIGRKMYFTKRKNWFVEIGLGIAFNIFNIKPDSPYDCEPLPLLPRPILQIGGRF